MFESVCVVGAGRVGLAAAARLGERLPTRVTGRELACGGADLVLLCVPDREIAGGRRADPVRPVGRPHERRRVGRGARAARAPLRRSTRCRRSSRGSGLASSTAPTGPSPASRRRRCAPASSWRGCSASSRSSSPTRRRPLYHAAATVAAAFLVTLHDAASELMEAAGAPPEALEPLMRRTIENGFRPTGPFVRGDRGTVEAHLEAIREARPGARAALPGARRLDREGARAMRIVESIADIRAALAPHRGTRSIGLVPTMGAFHAGHVSLMRAARAENDVAVVSLFVNPSQFAAGEDLDRYPRDPARDAAVAAEEGVDLLFAPTAAEIYPDGFQTWVEVERLGRGLEGARAARPFPRRRDRLPEAVYDRQARPGLLRAEGRPAGGGDRAARPRPRARARAAGPPHRPRRGRARAQLPQRLPVGAGAGGRAGPPPRARGRPRGARGRRRPGRGRRRRPRAPSPASPPTTWTRSP